MTHVHTSAFRMQGDAADLIRNSRLDVWFVCIRGTASWDHACSLLRSYVDWMVSKLLHVSNGIVYVYANIHAQEDSDKRLKFSRFCRNCEKCTSLHPNIQSIYLVRLIGTFEADRENLLQSSSRNIYCVGTQRFFTYMWTHIKRRRATKTKYKKARKNTCVSAYIPKKEKQTYPPTIQASAFYSLLFLIPHCSAMQKISSRIFNSNIFVSWNVTHNRKSFKQEIVIVSLTLKAESTLCRKFN